MAPPLLSFRATRGEGCPFSNSTVEFELRPGSCVRLAGNSGCGKTTLAMFVAGLSDHRRLQNLGIAAKCTWEPSIPQKERCGALFQNTTLLDSMTVAGNVAVALQACGRKGSEATLEIKRLIEAVGLDYARDAHKRPSQLSGGMARRASLALQLAQRKRVIVLDEPFVGLDPEAAGAVAQELLRLRRDLGTALLLVSHEQDLVALLMKDPKTEGGTPTSNGSPNDGGSSEAHRLENFEVALLPSAPHGDSSGPNRSSTRPPSLWGLHLWERFAGKLADYVGWSLPLIMLGLGACGLAVAMLSADLIARVDVTDPVLKILDREVRPLLKMATGAEENPMMLMMVKLKVKTMLGATIPKAKAHIYCHGFARLFVLEVGPLLTGLLMCGRLGGSYAGQVAAMRASSQDQLLRTLGVSPVDFTLVPALMAALVAGPILTACGTAFALGLGGLVVSSRNLGTFESYLEGVNAAVLPEYVRLDWAELPRLAWGLLLGGHLGEDDSAARAAQLQDALVEAATYPPVFLCLKAATYALVILVTAEASARLVWRDLTPKHVPGAITTAVVVAGLLVILADWAFSQLLLLRTW